MKSAYLCGGYEHPRLRLAFFQIAVMCLLVLTPSPRAELRCDDSHTLDPFRGTIRGTFGLVEGVVSDATVVWERTIARLPSAREQATTVTIRIDRVFSGDSTWVGRELVTTVTSGALFGGLGAYVDPPLKSGEKALWLVRTTRGGDRAGELVPYVTGFLEVGWPVRAQFEPRYKELLQFAGAIQTIAAGMDRASQVRDLMEYSASRVPEIASWAIGLLGDEAVNDSEIDTFLGGLLTDERLNIAGQVALDGALLKARQEAWQKSPKRFKLINRWVTARLPEKDAKRVVHRIDVIAQLPQYEGLELDQLLALSRKAILNDGISVKAREGLLSVLGGWTPVRAQRYADDTPAFEFMRDVVRDSTEPELQLTAAAFLHVFLQTDSERRRAVVLELKQSVKDEKLSKALDHSLRPPEPDRPTKLLKPEDLP